MKGFGTESLISSWDEQPRGYWPAKSREASVWFPGRKSSPSLYCTGWSSRGFKISTDSPGWGRGRDVNKCETIKMVALQNIVIKQTSVRAGLDLSLNLFRKRDSGTSCAFWGFSWPPCLPPLLWVRIYEAGGDLKTQKKEWKREEKNPGCQRMKAKSVVLTFLLGLWVFFGSSWFLIFLGSFLEVKRSQDLQTRDTKWVPLVTQIYLACYPFFAFVLPFAQWTAPGHWGRTVSRRLGINLWIGIVFIRSSHTCPCSSILVRT